MEGGLNAAYAELVRSLKWQRSTPFSIESPKGGLARGSHARIEFNLRFLPQLRAARISAAL